MEATPTVEAPTPWLAAQRAWDERYGDHITRARNWRFTAWVALAALLVSGIGNISQAVRAHFQVWLVAVGPDHRVLSSGSAEAVSVIGDDTKRVALGDWIALLRGVTIDPIVQRRWIDRSYDMIGEGSAAMAHISEWYRSNPPGERMRAETVEVQAETVLPVSEASYEITWTEVHHASQSGEVTGRERWKGMFSVMVDPPRRPEVAAVNPFGLYVTSVSWSKVFEGGNK